MIEIGRIVIKLAGRDAGKAAAVIDVIDKKAILIDGQTRRKKVNVKHVEFTNKKIEIQKGASKEAVSSEMAKLGYKFSETSLSGRKKESKDKKQKPVSKRTLKGLTAKPKKEKQQKPKEKSKPKTSKAKKKSKQKE